MPKEGSFKEFDSNRPSRPSKPRKRSFGGRNDKPDRRYSQGNSFKDDRRDTSRMNKQMFDATCSKCNKACKVPFKPTMGKPVSCSDCFVKKDSGFQSRGRDRNDRSGGFQQRDNRNRGFKPRESHQRFARSNDGPREMHDATCSKCNKACKVPFKPTQGKPVSCSNCFIKKDSGSGRRDNSRGRPSFGGRKSFGDKKPFNRGRK